MLTYLHWLAILYDAYGEYRFRLLEPFFLVNGDMAFLKRTSAARPLRGNRNFNLKATTRYTLFGVLSAASQEDEANGRRL